MFQVFDSRYAGRERLRPVLVVESGSALGSKSDADGDGELAGGDIEVVELGELARELFSSRNDGLWEHVVRDAEMSDMYLGRTPETWSPLGTTDLASAGRLSADLDLAKAMAREMEDDPLEPEITPHTEVEFGEHGGVPILGVRENDRVRAAAALGAFSIVIEIPAGSSGLELESYPVPAVENDLEIRTAWLEAYAGTLNVRRLLVWRLYRGRGSSVVDGVTQARDGRIHVQYPAVEHNAFLVARVALSAGRMRTRNDPFRRVRMAMAEQDGGLEIVRRIPRIEHAWPDAAPAVVAVHGTMSTAIPMAGELETLLPQQRVLRFEHDTWHSIIENSDLLAQQIWRLGAQRVALVAHSRGGLVARRAAEILAVRGRSDVCVVALGTPFAGTELVVQARGGLLGARVALGALRVLTGGMLDPISRLASLLFGKLPPGLDEMSPDSPFQTGYPGPRADSDLFAIAGDVDAEGAGEVAGLALSALHGIARAGYGRRGARGDLVVSVDSATAGVTPDRTLVAQSDHFSYLQQADVRQFIQDASWPNTHS